MELHRDPIPWMLHYFCFHTKRKITLEWNSSGTKKVDECSITVHMISWVSNSKMMYEEWFFHLLNDASKIYLTAVLFFAGLHHQTNLTAHVVVRFTYFPKLIYIFFSSTYKEQLHQQLSLRNDSSTTTWKFDSLHFHMEQHRLNQCDGQPFICKCKFPVLVSLNEKQGIWWW